MFEVPETRYAKSGGVNIGYQVVGDGPFDLVHVPAFVSNLELQWEDPAERRYFERLASFCRLIMFDKRGTGLSDRVAVATLEERMDDLRAVMDDVGSQRAAVFGSSEGGALSVFSPPRTPSACQHSFCTARIRAWPGRRTSRTAYPMRRWPMVCGIWRRLGPRARGRALPSRPHTGAGRRSRLAESARAMGAPVGKPGSSCRDRADDLANRHTPPLIDHSSTDARCA